MKRCSVLVVAVLGALALVGACGGRSSDHNGQDVSFAQGMIPHHRQAVEMADLAETRASNAQVKDLAVRIKAAQDPEIKSMTGWLTAWKEPLVSSGGGSMGGMDHGGGPSAGPMGMMSDADMSKLAYATGEAFDRMFVMLMTAHHNGAIAMAETELAKGKYPPAKDIATAIRDGQRREVTEMADILATLPIS